MGVLTGVLFLIVGGAMMIFAVYLAGRRFQGGVDATAAQREAQAIVEDARIKAELIIKEAELNRRDQTLRAKEKSLADREAERQELIEAARAKLEAVAGLTREEARRQMVEEMVGQARHDAARQIRVVEEEAREESDRHAKRIISVAIERLAGEFVTERTVSVLALPNDEMKGRIIGREGRNIRAIEAATGVDIIIDDTPEAIVISCHNPIRREIARVSLERLISDGRIHPRRIEEGVGKAG